MLFFMKKDLLFVERCDIIILCCAMCVHYALIRIYSVVRPKVIGGKQGNCNAND